MEPAKKIEPGCLAIILAAPQWPEWVGQIVTVVRFVGDYNGLGDFDDFWQVRIPTEQCQCFARQSDLLRIDDDGLQREIEQEREIVHG